MSGNHIFLMYCGQSTKGEDYRSWSLEDVKPLVTYEKQGGIDSFFQAFLLLAIRSGHGGALIPGFDNAGNKIDWHTWIQDIFLPDHNLAALFYTVKGYRLEPVDLWISLPYPDPNQKQFGTLWKHQPDLSNNQDRLFVLKWWIHCFLKKWHQEISSKKLDEYLTLRGFYWPRESMTLSDRILLPDLIRHIHSLGLQTLWIPYFASTPLLWALDPGFDRVIIQPSYLQNPDLGRKRLSEAAKRARTYGAGIEIEFDTSVLYENSVQYKAALDYLNYGLPEYEGYGRDNFVGYYTGYKTLVELYHKKSVFYDHLYEFVKGTYRKVNYPGIEY